VHHEGRSHGRELTSGIKAYQVINQHRLFERWQSVLERDHYPNAHNILRARDRSFEKHHVLVIDHYVPQWDRDAGSRSMYEIIRVLLEDGYSVTFWPDNLWQDPIYTPKLQALGVEVIYGSQFKDRFAEFFAERANFYDSIFLSRPSVAEKYIDVIRDKSTAKIVYYGHDVHFLRMMAQDKIEGIGNNAQKIAEIKALELSICNKSNVVLYPSTDEISFMKKIINKNVKSMQIPVYRFTEDEIHLGTEAWRRRIPLHGTVRLLFVGGFAHSPNVDGIKWFVDDVLPILKSRGLDIVINVVGSKPPVAVYDLQQSGAIILGFVTDKELHELYCNSDIVIAPLRYGAGVKGKVVEAMSKGVPVVTTDIGAQGLHGAREYLFIGNTAEEFATAIMEATVTETARNKALGCLNFIRSNYSTEAMRRVLRSALLISTEK
jgi:glycosyltransferase involved in cell wall biosynthesis